MASSDSSVMSVDPDYIQYLLDPGLDYDFHYVVGNAKLAPVEKIGVLRKILAAHSEVFRSQFHGNKWKADKPEEITDIFPSTFKNMLRFVYGFDTTAKMTFEDADDLLYVADRYLMTRLKSKLAVRLMSLLDYNNICGLLTNPACSKVLDLQSEITKILQSQTDKVLASPQFLSCCPDTFVKILEQEFLNVPELEVWRAALKWAKNKVTSEDSKILRQQLEKPLKHIRVCTLSYTDFCKEVAPTGILDVDEVSAVCVAHGTGQKPLALTAVCNNMEVRNSAFEKKPMDSCNKKNVKKQCVVKYNKSGELWVGVGMYGSTGLSRELSFTVKTRELSVEITRLRTWIFNSGVFSMTVRLELEGNTNQESVTCVTYSGHSLGNRWDDIPISTCDREVLLQPNTRYNIAVSCDTEFHVWRRSVRLVTREHFSLEFPQHGDDYGSPGDYIFYKTLTPL